MRKSYKYRAYPTKEAEKNANQWLYLCRLLYNALLEERIDRYSKQKYLSKEKRKSITKQYQQNELPDLKKEFPEFKEVVAQVIQQVVITVDKAFQAFFRRVKQGEKPGFPRFKVASRYKSFTLTQAGWKLEGNNLFITNVGKLHLKMSQSIQGDVKTVTVKKNSAGEWFVSFSCDNVPARSYPETNKAVGMDLGLAAFAYDTDGEITKHPKPFKTSLDVIREKSRALSKTTNKKSARYKRKKRQIAKEYIKEKNQRQDFAQKLSTKYVRENKLIAVEDLAIQELVEKKGKNLARNIYDSAWGLFLRFLEYKAEEASRILIKVNPRGTTQECCFCGTVVPKELWDRTHRCPVCGLETKRDHNSSWNILRRALVQLEPGQRSTLSVPEFPVELFDRKELRSNVLNRGGSPSGVGLIPQDGVLDEGSSFQVLKKPKDFLGKDENFCSRESF